MKTVETDVCIVGAGITAAMVAERLTEQADVKVTVIEAGNRIFNLADRYAERQRFLDYRENPWPDDHIPKMTGYGIQSRSMCVGGLGLHWGGTTPRFSPEDLRIRSMYGVGYDWPVEWEELDSFYQEVEERMGVAGTPGPADLDPRSRPYPMPALPLSYNLERLKSWAERSGVPFWANPVAKNSQSYRGRNTCVRCDTCTICPTGAKYTPDFTFQELLHEGKIDLLSRTVVRRLVPDDSGREIASAEALDRDRPDEPLEIRAGTFILAAGYAWSSYLLLLSRSNRFPQGIANSSGLVGCYISGHRPVNAWVEVPMKLYPGIYQMDSLLSKKFQRKHTDQYIRHDFRIWESAFGRAPRMRDAEGGVLLGDRMLEDWRSRSQRGAARLRAYYDVLPARESRLALDGSRKTSWGDPTFRIDLEDDPVSAALRGETERGIESLFKQVTRAGGGRILELRGSDLQDHPAGGCRMGEDPSQSVVDPYGQSHDHPNLWVVGSPTMPTAGVNNGTLTFGALGLRSAAKLASSLPARAVADSAIPHPAEVA